jgi:hypothetical protein
VFLPGNHNFRRNIMRRLFIVSILSVIAAFAAACGGADTGGGAADTGKVIKSGPGGNNITVTLASPDGVLRRGKQNFTLKFTDATGTPVDISSASLNFHMPAMGTMAVMNNAATLTTTGTKGVFAATVDLEMAGEWQAQVAYQGAAGTGKANLPITAQ